MKDLNKDFGKANKKLLDHAPAEIIKLIEKVFSKEYEAFKQDVENFNKYLDHYPLLKEMLFDLDTLNEASIKDLENYINQKALYRPTLNKKQKGVK